MNSPSSFGKKKNAITQSVLPVSSDAIKIFLITQIQKLSLLWVYFTHSHAFKIQLNDKTYWLNLYIIFYNHILFLPIPDIFAPV